jgi:hypothetical protein
MDYEKAGLFTPKKGEIHSPNKRNPKKGKTDMQQVSSPTFDIVTSLVLSKCCLWA